MPFTSDIRYLSLNIQTYKLRILSISQGNAVSQNKAKAVDEANRPDVFVGGARAKKIGPRRGMGWLAGMNRWWERADPGTSACNNRQGATFQSHQLQHFLLSSTLAIHTPSITLYIFSHQPTHTSSHHVLARYVALIIHPSSHHPPDLRVWIYTASNHEVYIHITNS